MFGKKFHQILTYFINLNQGMKTREIHFFGIDSKLLWEIQYK